MVESVVRGRADAVLSGLGPRSKAEAGVAWHGTRAITQVMDAAGVRRIVVVSAAPVGTVASPARPHPPRRDPGDGLVLASLAYPVLRAAFGRSYADAPDVDSVVYVTGKKLRPGQLVSCEVVTSQEYDLVAAALGRGR